MPTTDERLARIEAKLDRLIDLTAAIAQDALEASATAVQLRELHHRMVDETYDLRQRLGAPGYAPDRRVHQPHDEQPR